MGLKLTQNGTQIEIQNGTENENNKIHLEATPGSNDGKQREATGREATPGGNRREREGTLGSNDGKQWEATATSRASVALVSGFAAVTYIGPRYV